MFDEAVKKLNQYGVEILINIEHPAMAVLLAQAVNLAAKVIDEEFYDLKPGVIEYAASLPEVISGWGEDGAFYLWTKETGAVSFHDPYDQINLNGSWPYGWSGIRRQETAFQILAGDTELLRWLAEKTSPSELL